THSWCLLPQRRRPNMCPPVSRCRITKERGVDAMRRRQLPRPLHGIVCNPAIAVDAAETLERKPVRRLEGPPLPPRINRTKEEHAVEQNRAAERRADITQPRG